MNHLMDAIGINKNTYGEDNHLLKRIASPEEIAAGVQWLASEKSSFVTGVAMPVDGGFAIM